MSYPVEVQKNVFLTAPHKKAIKGFSNKKGPNFKRAYWFRWKDGKRVFLGFAELEKKVYDGSDFYAMEEKGMPKTDDVMDGSE